MWLASLQILFVLASPLLHLALGERVAGLVARLCGSDEQGVARGSASESACLYVLGLLVHLAASFALKLCGLHWAPAALLPLLPALWPWRGLRALLAGLTVRTGAAFTLWVGVSLVLGLSLFQVGEGIRTPWVNNYGDLAFHLGMIASFVFGDNFPPQYHLFAGETLSYPFFVNLWTASAWWVHPELASLRLLFVFQWVVLWCAVYWLLDGDRSVWLPWALLFGGGSYLALGNNSGPLIEENLPWTVFLTTVWVTQRAALLGTCSALAALWLFHASQSCGTPEVRRVRLALAATVLGLSPLVHVHICMAAALYIGLVLLLQRPFSIREVLTFACFLLPSLLALPWLLEKAGILKLMAGWVTGAAGALGGWERLRASAAMWASHAPVWFLLLALLWGLARKHARFAPLVLLFLAGNAVRLAVWDWDQLKLFIGIYVVFLGLWSVLPGRSVRLAQHACVLLILPAIYECWMILEARTMRKVYTEGQIEQARAVRERTPASAVIACAPRHNSLATLTGRKLFYGYEGTLWSHGIAFEERRRLMQDLEKLLACEAEVCPTHLLWTGLEQGYWRRFEPGGEARRTEIGFLYELSPAVRNTE